MKQTILLAIGCLFAGAAAAQSAAERTYIDSAFSAVDTDKDGVVTRLEFDAFMLARIEKQRAEFDQAFAAADENGNGYLDRTEAEVNPVLLEHFDKVDSNKDTKISKEELSAALQEAVMARGAAGAPSSTVGN